MDQENPLERQVKTPAESTANAAVTEPTATRHPGFDDIPKETPEMQLNLRSTRRPHCKTPKKSPQSPLRKKYRRMRTEMECKQQQNNSPDQEPSVDTRLLSDLTSAGTNKLDDFKTDFTEQGKLLNLKLTASLYTLQKLAAARNQQAYIDFQAYFGLINNHNPPESSNVAYLSVIDQKVDDKLTLIEIMNRLHDDFITKLNKRWLLLETDGAVYHKIQSIKTEYGEELSWLIPFPGD